MGGCPLSDGFSRHWQKNIILMNQVKRHNTQQSYKDAQCALRMAALIFSKTYELQLMILLALMIHDQSINCHK